MAQAPTGMVTFVFTDIEGSTQHWEKHPELMQPAFARQEAIISAAMAARGGYVYKMIGDAFQVAFAAAPEALDAALDAQRTLQSEPWGEIGEIRVRMALHTGITQERGDDYVGPALNRAARVMSAGHGGQVLLTQATYELVRDHLPTGCTLRDMGERRLKDLIRPEHIYQLIAPGLLQDFAPLKALDLRPNNLPAQVTSFVGREREIAEVKHLLDTTRLLTLTGSGGAGKTRLSLQVAADLVDEFDDGVWLVELAPLADPARVPQAAAAALGLREEARRAMPEVLTDHLRDRSLLLMLDNCEHLVEACAQLAYALLRACPRLKILASSREALRVTGETTFRVPSLALPPLETAALTPASLNQYEAVRLFVERAVAAAPRFEVTNANAPAVAQICRRLDGIPLAIELAAARVRALSVEQIAARLDDRFRLLTGGNRAALPRQQTLRALVDWSHDLLPEDERIVWRRLAVFAGGWTLDAAEAICTDEYLASYEVADLLFRLVDRSLVSADERGEQIRYHMLETLRQYAGEKLDSSAETDLYRQIHCEYFLKLAEEAEPQLTGTEQAQWFDRLETEHDNLRAAIQWAVGAARTEMAQRLCGALGRFWWVHGQMAEGRRWLQQALALREGVAQEVQAKALRWAGGLAWPQGDLDAARMAFDESLSLYRELGDTAGIATVLGNLGTVAQNQGDYAGAWEMFSQSLVLLRELGNEWGIANALNNLGNVAQEQGNYVKAQTLHEESLAFRRKLGDTRGMGIALNNLGSIALEQNKLESARAYFETSLEINYEISARLMLAYNLSGMAQVLGGEGQSFSAAQLQGATSRLLEEMGAPLESYEQALYEKTAMTLKQTLSKESYQQAFDAGRAMSLEQAIDLARRSAHDRHIDSKPLSG